MTDADKTAFVKIILGLKSVKPGQPLSEEGIELFWNALREDWEFEEFKAAANHLARSVEFMPNPFHFEQLRKAARPTAGEALDRARRAAGSCVSNGHVGTGGSCGDPLIDRAVRAIGGYAVIFLCDVEKLTFLERRFCEHYESIWDADEVRENVPQLAAPRSVELLEGPERRPEPMASKPAPQRSEEGLGTLLRKSPPAHEPRDLAADVRKLAAAGFDTETIAKSLAPRGVTLAQVRDCLAECEA